MSRTASQTEVLLALAPRIDAPPDLVDDSDDDEMWPSLFQDSDNDLGARSPIRVGHRDNRDDEGAIMAMWEQPFFLHGGRSLGGLRAFEAPRILLITVGEMMPDLIEHSEDDEMPALVADDPSFKGTCRSPAWGCAKPGRQG